MARIRDAAWHRLCDGFRISVSSWSPYYGAGNAATMLSSMDLALTQRSRAAWHLDIYAGGRELDSRVGPYRATLPPRLLEGADRN